MVKKPVKKWKIVVSILLVVLIGGGAGYLAWWRADRNLIEVSLASVTRSDVTKTFSTSAPVESKSKSVFQVLDGVKVLTVNVKVGDNVNAGDVLATFDTSSLSEKQNSLQTEYDNALVKYNDAVKAAKTAADALPALEAEIAALEEKSDSASSSTSSGLADILGNLNILELLLGGGDISSLLSGSLGGLTGQTSLLQLQLQKLVLETQMSDSYLNTLQKNSNDAKSALDMFTMQINSLKNGWKAEKHGIVSTVNIKAGEVYVYTDTSSSDMLSGLDLSSILGSMTGDVDLSALISMLTGSASTEEENPGVGIGILIENYDEFVATFSLGKYDMQNVQLGQKALISSVTDEYEGEVTYISATASSSSSVDISSMLGSLSGTGGGSSNTAEGIVTIKNPDEGIVIGFDVDINIITDEVQNALILPVEAIRLVDGERCVYTYNKDSRTISLRHIKVGISDDTKWEIIDGLEEGEQVIRTFSGSSKLVEDGMKVKLAE